MGDLLLLRSCWQVRDLRKRVCDCRNANCVGRLRVLLARRKTHDRVAIF